MNSPGLDQLAHHAALGAERRDEGAEHDQAGIDEQLRHLADAADVLDAVGIGEAEVAVEAVADIVAVEQHGVARRARCSCCSTRLAIVDLPEPDRPVNHRIAGFWPLQRARAPPCRRRAPADGCWWRAAARSRSCRRRPCALVKRSIRMKAPVVAVVAHRGRRRSAAPVDEIAEADLVERQRAARPAARSVLTSILCLSAVTVAGTSAGADLHQVGAARAAAPPRAIQSRCAANWSATSGRSSAADQHVAARDVDLVGERQRDGVAGRGLGAGRRPSVTMRVDRARSCPDAATTTASPAAIAPRGDRAGRSRGNRGSAG